MAAQSQAIDVAEDASMAAQPQIEVADDARSFVDEGYESTLCSTESVRSSIYDYETQHGRTYHAYHAGKYVLPNDEGEQDRMEMHYHNLRLALHDRIFLAPIEAPTGILDVGTGTGTWAMDVADAHPQADVVGFDLSPIQPTYVPPNLQFEVLDAEESWGYAANRFDLIHTRFMNGVSLKSWPHFYAEAMTCLKPGGWVENQEFDLQYVCDDNSIPENSNMQEWVELWNRGAEMGGITGRCYPHLMAQDMRDAGLVNVEVKNFMMPVGPWPRDRSLNEAGTYGLVAMHDGLHGLSVKVFKNFLGWTIEDLEVFLTAAKAEMRDRSIHAYWPAYVVLGQKPLS